MMRKAAVLFAAVVLTACDVSGPPSKCGSSCMTQNNGGAMTHGSGVQKTETRPVGRFTAVRVASSATVLIEQTGNDCLTVTGDDNLVSFFTSEVRDGTLNLDYTKGRSFEGRIPVYRITMGDLRAVEVAGSGDIEATNLKGDALKVSVAGSGDARLAGEVNDLAVTLSGSGDVDAAKLTAKRVTAEISGSGDLTVSASDALDAKIRGSGNIVYIGSPKITSSVTGSGTIKAKP
jgi:hypothetical protein